MENKGGSKLCKKEKFGNVMIDENFDFWGGPDGMKFDINDNLYVAVWEQGDITILGQDGSVNSRIKTIGKWPTNLCFGLSGDKTIYVTECENGSIEKIKVESDGLPLYK